MEISRGEGRFGEASGDNALIHNLQESNEKEIPLKKGYTSTGGSRIKLSGNQDLHLLNDLSFHKHLEN